MIFPLKALPFSALPSPDLFFSFHCESSTSITCAFNVDNVLLTQWICFWGLWKRNVLRPQPLHMLMKRKCWERKKETLKYHIRAGYWSQSKARQSEVYILGLQPATVDSWTCVWIARVFFKPFSKLNAVVLHSLWLLEYPAAEEPWIQRIDYKLYLDKRHLVYGSIAVVWPWTTSFTSVTPTSLFVNWE